MNNNVNTAELNDLEKKNMMSLIAQQDIKQLRSLPLNTFNLNFLIEDNDIHFDKGISPLLSACYIGKIEIVMIILDNEAVDVDLTSSPECYSPLMVACFKGFYEIVRLLLEHKASVNLANRMGQKPILFCFSRLEESYYKYENKKICMMLLELLLPRGADINVRIDDKLGYTVLMKLSSIEISSLDKFNNTVEMFKFLIERGADPFIKGYNNKTAIEVINSKTPKNFKAAIIDILENTKQTVFYDKENNNINDLNDPPIFKKNTKRNDTCIIVERSEMRMNCCNIY